MEKEAKKKTVLKGIEVPEWYLDIEPKLLEQMNELAKAESKLKSIRATIMSMMDDEKIDCIKSDFAVVTRTKDAVIEQILKEKLKEEMPKVYELYLKRSVRKGTLNVKLNDV